MFVNLPIKKISWLTFGAIFSVILGYISFKLLPDLIVKVIQGRVKLAPSSPVYELWRDAPVDIYHKFYFFNITNSLEIERKGAKPIIREVGPFVYNIKFQKVPVVDNGNDTVTYRELKQWFFNPELSAYDENYVITTVNSPLISALNIIQRAPQPLRSWISITLDSITEGIFIRRTVKQLTFYGYPDILVSLGTLINPKTPNNHGRFAYLAGKNNSAEAEYTIFSGIKVPEKMGLVERIDGLNHIAKWKDHPCRDLNDTYTGQMMYSPMESSKMSIQMFNDLFGRKMNLKYRGTVDSYPGLKTYRYSFDENNFKNAIDFPPNKCYTSSLPKTLSELTNGTNNNPPAIERQNSPASILLNLARRRFGDSGASPLVNLFNRNILSRPLVTLSNNPTVKPPTISQPTTTTTTTTTTVSPDLHNNDETMSNNNDVRDEQPTTDESDSNNINGSNSAESLIMTTTETNTLNQPIHSNGHSNGDLHNNNLPLTPPPNHHLPSVIAPSREHNIAVEHPSDVNLPKDANLFSRPNNNAESRQDPFSSTLGTLFSNRVRESPLLSFFAPRDSATTNSPDNSRLNGRLFNRNGNNVLGNLISNGLNRLLNLRNARRMEDANSNESTNEPNRTVLSRSVRNALRRVTRNTGPITTGSHNQTDDHNNLVYNNDQYPNGRVLGKTTPEEYAALRKQNMFPSGAWDFSEIAFGAPILLSQPHFLNADSYYNDRLVGMEPNAEKHDFFIDVEPITGSSIRTAIRVQINVALLKSPNVFRFRNFKEHIFPVFWQEIDMSLPEKYQSMLRMVGAAPNAVSEIVLCICIIIALALFTTAVFIFAKAKTKNVPETNDFAHRPSETNETIGALSGQPVDNKFGSNVASNPAYQPHVNNNNNNLSSFNKHKSKENLHDDDDQSQLHPQEREQLQGIDNPIPVIP